MATAYDTATQIKTLLKAYLEAQGVVIKTYDYGDPGIIPDSGLPAIFVSPIDSDYPLGSSMSDENTETIEIRIIINRKNDYMDAQAGAFSSKTLHDMIEAQEYDSVTGRFNMKSTSIIALLRTKLTLDYHLAVQETRVRYEESAREDIPTKEAIITIVAIHDVYFVNRT